MNTPEDPTTPEPTTTPAENIIQLGPIKKVSTRPTEKPLIVAADAQGNIKPEQKKELMLVPYPDGILFRCSPKPNSPSGAFLIHDGAGQIVGACIDKDMANLFCEALHVYFQAAKQNATAQVAVKQAGKVVDTLDIDATLTPESPAPSPEEGK